VPTTVVTANLLYTMPARDAAAALDAVLAPGPDLVALQEWYLPRLGILRRRGRVRLDPALGLPPVPVPGGRGPGPRYHWVATLADDNVVGARADRYDLLEARSVLLIGPARSERQDRFLRTEPPRFVAAAVFRDRVEGGTVALLSYHLTPGVQRRGAYRDADRPRMSARHREEVRRLEQLVAELHAEGHVVHAAGDGNFDGLRLRGLTSAWEGREHEPGTIDATRKLDDVFGPGPATRVTRVVTASDHEAVVVERA
jgi:hypothetical protein